MHDCDGFIDRSESSCDATFTMVFSDDTSVYLNGCEDWSLSSSFEFDPDDIPEVLGFELVLSGATSDAFECQLSLEQEDVCGTGYYRIGDGHSGSSELITLDCSGVADEFEGTFDMAGFLELTDIDTGEIAGDFSGVGLQTGLSGRLFLEAADGSVQLSGDFAISADATPFYCR